MSDRVAFSDEEYRQKISALRARATALWPRVKDDYQARYAVEIALDHLAVCQDRFLDPKSEALRASHPGALDALLKSVTGYLECAETLRATPDWADPPSP